MYNIFKVQKMKNRLAHRGGLNTSLRVSGQGHGRGNLLKGILEEGINT